MLHVLASISTGTPPFFALLTIVFIAVVALSLLLVRFRQSLMAGYFICGAILANSGILDSVAGASDNIHSLADIGMILLMFTLGVEFSLDELKHLRKTSFVGGGIQMGVCTVCFGAGLYYWMDLPLATSLTVGAIVGLSSTAVSLKSFQEFNLGGTSGARMALGIALFQDIFAIMLVAIMPQIFAERGEGAALDTVYNIGLALSRGVIFLLVAWLIGRYVLPWLMLSVSRTKSRELFTLTVVAICSGIAMFADMMELSLALGAFIAGLVVSGSYYSHRVLSEILPFKDLFLTIFFVSAGLLIDINSLLDHFGNVMLITAGVLIVKFVSCILAARALNLSGKMGLMASTSLTNVGEFSLVLLPLLTRLLDPLNESLPDIVTGNIYAIAAISMGLTPIFMKLALKAAPLLARLPGFHGGKQRITVDTLTEQLSSISDHAIICGYGPVGRRLHKGLDHFGVPTIIIDLNADTVKSLLNEGTTAILGDVQHEITMELAAVSKARLIAFTFPDITPALATHRQLMMINPALVIMARAKFPSEVTKLRMEGINNIIHDEAETAIAAIRFAHRTFDIILNESDEREEIDEIEELPSQS